MRSSCEYLKMPAAEARVYENTRTLGEFAELLEGVHR